MAPFWSTDDDVGGGDNVSDDDDDETFREGPAAQDESQDKGNTNWLFKTPG